MRVEVILVPFRFIGERLFGRNSIDRCLLWWCLWLVSNFMVILGISPGEEDSCSLSTPLILSAERSIIAATIFLAFKALLKEFSLSK